jgi:hypothetical protein
LKKNLSWEDQIPNSKAACRNWLKKTDKASQRFPIIPSFHPFLQIQKGIQISLSTISSSLAWPRQTWFLEYIMVWN